MHGDYHTNRMHGFGDRFGVVEGVFREKPVSIKIKKFCRRYSTSLLTRNPVKDSDGDFYHFYKKNHHLAISAQQSLFWKGWNTDVVNSIWCTKKEVPLYIWAIYSSNYLKSKNDLILHFVSILVMLKDDWKAQQILSTTDPLTRKRLGKKVNGFDAKVWSSQCVNIDKRGETAKVYIH